jgi:hypothetical protein
MNNRLLFFSSVAGSFLRVIRNTPPPQLLLQLPQELFDSV